MVKVKARIVLTSKAISTSETIRTHSHFNLKKSKHRKALFLLSPLAKIRFTSAAVSAHSKSLGYFSHNRCTQSIWHTKVMHARRVHQKQTSTEFTIEMITECEKNKH
jgi:hypothetical protein